MLAVESSRTAQPAMAIPYVTADEAHHLLTVQLERLLDVLDSLAPEDWSRPTACSAWNVKDMVAHQAGGYASGTGYGELFRQYLPAMLTRGLPEDVINTRQVGERAQASPAELIAELRRVGPRAARNWAYGFRLLRPLTLPHPVAGLMSMGHLNLVVHSRDTWMHRLDICRATGKPFIQDPEHEGRIAALVMVDVAKAMRRRHGSASLTFDLSGPSGGCWNIGPNTPQATLRMDALDFNIFVSGRFTPEQGLERATITGDRALAEKVMRDLLVLF